MMNHISIRGIVDPWASAADTGWDLRDAGGLASDLQVEADVVVVGTGAGGGVTAEVLASAGLKVVVLEAGRLKSSDQFDMIERDGLSELYAEGAMQRCKDGAILLAQGRNVGGGTTVNWCSTFRTPDRTLEYWASEFGVRGNGPADLRPWFEAMEARFKVAPWAIPPNANNAVIRDGGEALGYHWAAIPRNVHGCINIGYCGIGCPVDAKQSTLVTTLPAALDEGATLFFNAQVQTLEIESGRVRGVQAVAVDAGRGTPTGRRISVRARHTVLACGGIHTPGVLLRSDVPDPGERIGKRTFLHPVVNSIAQYERTIDPYYGAPQTVYSDEFTWKGGLNGPMGYKIEALPLLPGTFAALIGGHGAGLQGEMEKLANTNVLMAFLRDGFHPESQGGTVALGDAGAPVLDYPVNDYVGDGARRAYASMMEIQLAAGAERVRPGHIDGTWIERSSQIRSAVRSLSMDAARMGISSAHIMGGCAMGETDAAVTDSGGRFRNLEGLSIHDGSIFPTALGTNPQMSIFAHAARFSNALASELGGAAIDIAATNHSNQGEAA